MHTAAIKLNAGNWRGSRFHADKPGCVGLAELNLTEAEGQQAGTDVAAQHKGSPCVLSHRAGGSELLEGACQTRSPSSPRPVQVSFTDCSHSICFLKFSNKHASAIPFPIRVEENLMCTPLDRNLCPLSLIKLRFRGGSDWTGLMPLTPLCPVMTSPLLDNILTLTLMLR